MNGKVIFPHARKGTPARVAHVPVETEVKTLSALEVLARKGFQEGDEVDIESNPPKEGKILRVYRNGQMRVAVRGEGVLTLTGHKVNKKT
jgi:hypothetical protein